MLDIIATAAGALGGFALLAFGALAVANILEDRTPDPIVFLWDATTEDYAIVDDGVVTHHVEPWQAEAMLGEVTP